MDSETKNQSQVPMPTPNEGKPTSKPSRWIGIIAIVLFVILGGVSHCPWYMWVVLIILGLLTFGGTSKWVQLCLGAILLIWGTPDFDDIDNESQQTYQSGSLGNSAVQSESERKIIESDLRFLERQKARFDHAVEIGDMREAERISNDVWVVKQQLEEKNLTPEQRRRLSRLFAI